VRSRTKPREAKSITAAIVVGVVSGVVAPVVAGIVLYLASPLLQDLITQPSCDSPGNLRLVKVESASSEDEVLKENVGGELVVHEPRRAVDGDTSTAWVEGVTKEDNPYGVGSSIKLTLPDDTDIAMICVVNGYAKSSDTFLENARVRQWTVTTDAGSRVSVLADKPTDRFTQYQSLDLLEGRTSTLSLRIESIRAGSGAVLYTDTALSEIEVWAR
jgi:hypothetical protein